MTRCEAFRLIDASGAEAMLTNAGAALMALRVPDRAGQSGDIVLGFDEPERYLGAHPHFGVVVGRYANRIANARFTLGGRSYALLANEGANQLHGGPSGFGCRVWEAERFEDAAGEGVRFELYSQGGDAGFPGALRVRVDVQLAGANALLYEMLAEPDGPTFVSLTAHPYFNLRDGGASSVLDHTLEIAAEAFTPVDAAGLPTGELLPVAGSAFDFRRARRLGAEIEGVRALRGGYDHNFALAGEAGTLRRVARLAEPASGRTLELETTLPGLQLYTGNFLAGNLVGRGGVAYARHAGVCLEAQHFPDAPNQPLFPSALCTPDAPFRHTIVYRWGVQGAG